MLYSQKGHYFLNLASLTETILSWIFNYYWGSEQMSDDIDEKDIKNIDIKKDTDTLLALYKIANDEEKYFLKEHQSPLQ